MENHTRHPVQHVGCTLVWIASFLLASVVGFFVGLKILTPIVIRQLSHQPQFASTAALLAITALGVVVGVVVGYILSYYLFTRITVFVLRRL